MMKYRTAIAADLPQIARFLEQNDLPTLEIQACLENFVVAKDQDGSWIGVAGFEHYGKSCLLRSVAVDKSFRGQGYGQTLVKSVLANAKTKGVKTVYVLTEDTSAFFERLGFGIIERKDVDEAVKKSPEFTESCCQSCTAMRRMI